MSDASQPADAARKPRDLPLLEAVRRARIESAERSAVVVDLRDAEVARLEILNDALNPLFADIPNGLDMFDRAISRGETPRLWIDMVAHVVMGRDKRAYRFVRDTSNGRVLLADSHDVAEMVEAITRYVARRIVERERMLAAGPEIDARDIASSSAEPAAEQAAIAAPQPVAPPRPRHTLAFTLGMLTGVVVLVGGLLLLSGKSY